MKSTFASIYIFFFLSLASQAASLPGVKLSKQAKALVAGDICAKAAVASVRDYISDLNDQAGTDIPDGGYPSPYVKQVLEQEDGIFSILVTNYQLGTLNVKTKKTKRGCHAEKPYTESFFPGH